MRPPISRALTPLGQRFGKVPSSLLNGALHYYTLDETSGTRYDSIGTAHLSKTGTPDVGYGAGKIGNAASFVGAATALGAAGAVIPASGPFGISFWLTAANSTPNQGVIGQYNASGRGVLAFLLAGSLQYLALSGGAQPYTPIGAIPSDGSWHHAILTYDGLSEGWGYVDNSAGVKAFTGIVFSDPWGADFEIGNHSGVAFPLTGKVDEVLISNRVWTPAERSALWNAGAGNAYPF